MAMIINIKDEHNIQLVGKIKDYKFFCVLMQLSNQPIYSLYYAAPVSYYASIVANKEITIDLGERFKKGSYRNRCLITGANGNPILSIPLKKGNVKKTAIRDIRISYDHPWQKVHWDSLCAAYRRSPFFEHYENDFVELYKNKFEKLVDFNLEIQTIILRLLKSETKIHLSNQYMDNIEKENDFRLMYDEKPHLPIPRYMQVFEDRNGFIEDLSIFDLLFNKGNRALEYLEEL